MVVLSELTSVFWGVVLEGGKKKYTQTTEKPVHISMAALDPSKPCGDGPVSVMIEHSTGSYVLCTLQKGTLFQQPLNLEFAAGEEISFVIIGTGSVHLSGYVMPEDDFQQYGDMSGDEDLSEEDMESEEEEEDSDEDEAVTKPGKKRQLVDAKRASKKAKITLADIDDDDDEDDSDDDDFIVDEAEEASDDEDEDDEEEEEEEESDVEESPKPVGKKNKVAVVDTAKTNSTTPSAKNKDKAQNISTTVNAAKNNSATPTAKNVDKAQNEKNTPKQQQAPAAATQPKEDGEAQSKKKKKKKNKKKNKADNQQQTAASPAPSTSASPAPASKEPAKRVAEGGVVIEDMKQGHGPEAKPGKKVAVYYTGRLLNGKVFDCCTSGNGFKFKLGKKEVISGWDVGVSGMKVGGKRKLIIPAKMGYGSSAAGPIPANSTLVFDVELKSVN